MAPHMQVHDAELMLPACSDDHYHRQLCLTRGLIHLHGCESPDRAQLHSHAATPLHSVALRVCTRGACIVCRLCDTRGDAARGTLCCWTPPTVCSGLIVRSCTLNPFTKGQCGGHRPEEALQSAFAFGIAFRLVVRSRVHPVIVRYAHAPRASYPVSCHELTTSQISHDPTLRPSAAYLCCPHDAGPAPARRRDHLPFRDHYM